MNNQLFDDFMAGSDTLRIYEGGRLVFASDKDRLLPLLEYIDSDASSHANVIIMDRIAGNAAALLAIKADCGTVYSPVGSELAVDTLDRHHKKYYFNRIIPHILKADGKDICPMEKLSIGKTPDEFYEALKALTR